MNRFQTLLLSNYSYFNVLPLRPYGTVDDLALESAEAARTARGAYLAGIRQRVVRGVDAPPAQVLFFVVG